MSTILIVDDEAGVRSSLAGVLRDEGYEVETVDSGEACLERAAAAAYDAVLLDVWLPGLDGLATLERLRERRFETPVIMISGHGTIETALRATKLGAFDFIEKPLSIDKTVLAVRNAIRQRRLEAENRALRARVDRPVVLVGDSPLMRQLREQIATAAPSNGRVLISGENGTGKEVVARTLHLSSRRRQGPFIEVNCAAIPEELIESELFGHLKGAFTGAVADRRGKFELANGGTLFLDEIGDMSLKTQAKVLRALQEQVIEPVGGHASVRVDVRVLAATNKELPEQIRAGQFREDLFFRLNVIPLHVPPLRARAHDVIRLAEHFIAEFAAEYGRRIKQLSPDAEQALLGYRWPGNVRELRNVIERLMIMVPSDVIAREDLWFMDEATDPAPASTSRPAAAAGASAPLPSFVAPVIRPLYEARDDWERDYLTKALAAFDGNMSKTADALGVERSNLYRKMRSLGLQGRKDEDGGLG